LDNYIIGGETITGYSARGRGGQFIFVFPDLKLTVVFTGGNDNQLSGQPYEMLVRSRFTRGRITLPLSGK